MPRDIQFSDTSAPGTGRTITAREWSVVGGSVFSTAQNPLLEGATDDAFDVRLVVTQDDAQADEHIDTIPATDAPPVPATLTITTAEAPLTVGATRQLTYDLTGTEPITVAWASSNTNIATVSSTGLVTAVAAGSATITATPSNAAGEGTADTYALTVEAAGGGVTVFNSDDFVGADDTPLLGRAPTWQGGPGAGGNWERVVGTGTLRILENGLAINGGEDTYFAQANEPGSADQSIELQMFSVSSGFFAVDLRLRWNKGNTFYRLYRHNTMWRLGKQVSGDFEGWFTDFADAVVTGETHDYHLEMETISASSVQFRLYKDGTLAHTWNDNSNPILGASGSRWLGVWNDGGGGGGVRILQYRITSL